MSKSFCIVLCFCFFVISGNRTARAFGLNKVQYNRFEWSYYQTEHFNIYFPQDGDTVAYFTAENVEDMYQSISQVLGHELTGRVPIIIHNSHTEFEQTNVVRFPLHEAIGGFTEMFKNRIVLPFEGNYADFYHVLKHEMVHAFINNLLAGDMSNSGVSSQGAYRFPLWINEGLAEYISLGWDISSEFFMLDATTSGYVSSPVVEFGGFMAYKGGQMFFHFLENAYGRGTIKKLIRELVLMRNLDRAFKKVTNTSLEEAGEIWLRELRYIYWPELGQRTHGKTFARKLTNHGKDLSFYNLQPAISPDLKEIAFFSDRGAREGVYILNLETEKITRSVIKGGTKGKFESFHSFKSGLAWGPGSERLAIVSKGKGRDVIHIIDAKSGKVLEEISPDVQAILSPGWSRDGRYVCFSGMINGYTDIYIWDRDRKTLVGLTHDLAYDGKPCFSPSGKFIAFESDRKELDGNEWTERLNIYRIKTDGSDLARISRSDYDDKMPCYGHSDSLVIFISNRSGIDNLYLSKDTLNSFFEIPLTNIIAGCYTPSWSVDGNALAFTIFEQGGWDIFLMRNPLIKQFDKDLPRTHFIKSLEDTSMSFFRPINWENLSSFEKDTASGKDSLSAKTDTLPPVRDSLAINGDEAVRGGDTLLSLQTDSISPGKDALTHIPQTLPPDSDSLVPEKEILVVKKDSLSDTDTLAMDQTRKRPKYLLDSSEYLDTDGLFIKRNYTPVFSLDVAAAALGVSNFEGSFGQGFIVLTDLMGDQEIEIALTLNGDIRDNSQVALAYHYLPYKVDYILGGFYRSFDNSLYFGSKELSWGAYSMILYPLSLFTRWQFELLTQHISREAIVEVVQDSVWEVQENTKDIFYPSLVWSHDNAQWGMVGPVNGQRINARFSVVPPVFEDNIFFYVGDLDLRRYWMFWKKYSLVMRINAGFSEAIGNNRNPHSFLLGGDDFINIYPIRTVGSNLPESIDIEGLFFSEFSLPLRGFDYFEFTGNRKVLSNLEFRFPFIRELTFSWPIPLSIRQVAGVIFADYGAAWTLGREFYDSQGLGMGWGMRINLGVFVLRWTRAYPVEGIGNRKKSKTDYWSLGAEF
ncbi:BamA/TamA family outer membrane protein [Fibrobacterota bacterium]